MSVQAFIFNPKYTEGELKERFQGKEEFMHKNGLAPDTEFSRVRRKHFVLDVRL